MLTKSRGAQRRRLAALISSIENLEQRRLLASTLNYSGGTYSQNFDGLIDTGSVSSPANPMDLSGSAFQNPTPPAGASSLQGWNAFVAPSGTWNTGATSTPRFGSDTGASGTGSIYSYGVANATNRALGSTASGSDVGAYGVELINSTSSTITSFTVSYQGETFHFGDNTSVQNVLNFGYEIGSSPSISDADGTLPSPAAGTFTPVPSLYYNATTPSTVPLAQANAAAGSPAGTPVNIQTITQTIAGVSWGVGQTLILRWHDFNEGGNDYGVALDNMTFAQAALTPGTISFNSASYSGQEGVNSAINFNIQRTGGATGQAIVDYTIPATGTGITATQGTDYTAPMAVAGTASTGAISGGYSGTVTFLNGQTSATVSVPIVADSTNEPTEDFTMSLSDDPSDTSGVTVPSPTTATGLIYDNNPVVPSGLLLNELDVNPPGDGTAGHTDGPNEYVEIINTSSSPQSLNDVDFLSIEGDVNSNAGNITYSFPFSGTLNPGQIAILEASSGGPTPAAGALVFTDPLLSVSNGQLQNGTNTFALVYSETPLLNQTDLDTTVNSSSTASSYPENSTLQLSSNQTLLDSVGWHDKGTGSSGDGTIYSTADVSVTGIVDGAATRIPGDTAANTTADWYAGSLFSASGDPTSLNYDPSHVTSNFPAGGVLTPGGANFFSTVTSGQIGFTASIAAVNEDAGTLVLTVNRVAGSADVVTVDWAINAGTASQGSDYSAPVVSSSGGSTTSGAGYSGTITFSSGQTSATITIPIVNDNLAEPTETFSAALTNSHDLTNSGNAPLLGPITSTAISIGDNDTHLLLSELLVNVPFEAGNVKGTDQYNEFVEISGTPGQVIPANTYFVSVEGDGVANAGNVTYAIDLGGTVVGSNGLIEIRSENAASVLPPPAPGTTVVNGDSVDSTGTANGFNSASGALQNGTNSFLIISSADVLTFSGTPTLGQSNDVDTNNDGTLDLGALGAHLVDGVGWTDGNTGDVAYGALLNFGGFGLTPSIGSPPAEIAPAAGMRLLGTTDTPDINSQSTSSLKAAGDWYYGDLVGSENYIDSTTQDTIGTGIAPDDRLVFENDGSAGRYNYAGDDSFTTDPNAHLTPGELNYNTPPFVELPTTAFSTGTTNPVLNLDFSSNVSQTLSTGQLTLTNTDTSSTVAGLSIASETSAQAFTNGYVDTVNLPTGLAQGHYKLTVSSGVTDDFGLASTASYSVNFTVLYGDANGDGKVNALDFNILATNFGTAGNYTKGDFDYSGQVGSNDFAILAANYNKTVPTTATLSSPGAVAEALPSGTTPASSVAASSASLFSNEPISGSLVGDLLN